MIYIGRVAFIFVCARRRLVHISTCSSYRTFTVTWLRVVLSIDKWPTKMKTMRAERHQLLIEVHQPHQQRVQLQWQNNGINRKEKQDTERRSRTRRNLVWCVCGRRISLGGCSIFIIIPFSKTAPYPWSDLDESVYNLIRKFFFHRTKSNQAKGNPVATKSATSGRVLFLCLTLERKSESSPEKRMNSKVATASSF